MAKFNRLREIERRKREQDKLPPIADPEELGVGLKRCPMCNTVLLLEEQDCPKCSRKKR